MAPLKVLRWPRPLVGEGNAPIFLLGDAAWELVHRLDRDEIEAYLAARAEQGFRAIWFVLLTEFGGLRTPNRGGELPLHEMDPHRPNERYFELVDFAVERIAANGMVAAILPTWGDKVTLAWGEGPVVFPLDDLGAAEAYGEFVGARYGGHDHVMWGLGGDRPARSDFDGIEPETDWRPVWRAMSAGLDRGAGRHLLTTFHPSGGEQRTSTDLHEEPWLDVHALQSGHAGRDEPGWEWAAFDLGLAHPKPVLDVEPNYEDHPVSAWPEWDPESGYFDDRDARKAAWRTAFAGACGVTYGHHSVWQFATDDEATRILHAKMPWREALTRPGAESMGHLRRFLEGRHFATMRPDPSVLVHPGDGAEAKEAMRGDDEAWIYLPEETPFLVNYPARAGEWFDPRTGETLPGALPSDGATEYTPPGPGDWVLVLTR